MADTTPSIGEHDTQTARPYAGMPGQHFRSWTSIEQFSMAAEPPLELKIVWSASLPVIPRLCYDKVPAVIYARYDLARKTTSILKRELNGEERILGEFPGSRDERSLSCSQDGQTIAALDAQKSTVFLMRGAETALYRFSRFWAFSNVGRYSFLSPDGKRITLAETPSLISGANPSAGHQNFSQRN